jgi:hypothetical protein
LRSRRVDTLAIPVALAASLLASPQPAAAQTTTASHDDGTLWEGQLAVLSINALAGGLTAGIAAWIRGGDVRAAFAGGAAGGSVAFLGKHLVGSHPHSGGLIGRQVAQVGHDVIMDH